MISLDSLGFNDGGGLTLGVEHHRHLPRVVVVGSAGDVPDGNTRGVITGVEGEGAHVGQSIAGGGVVELV